MENAALNRPPTRLERLVAFFTPPAAREAVVGDLCETYRSPAQFAIEAMCTLPLVIASQMRRNLNIPALGLQGFLIFFCLGGGTQHGAHAATATTLALLLMMLRDAYRATERQTTRRAMGEALVAMLVTWFVSRFLTLGMPLDQHLVEDDFRWLRFGFMALWILPVLCLFRTALIVEGDRRTSFEAGELSEEAVVRDYCRFARRVCWMNRLEAMALGGGAGLMLLFRLRLGLADPALAMGLLGIYVFAAAYLLAEARVQSLPERIDFLSLRALYQQELTRRQQLRRFLWWLWLAPLLIALHAGMIEEGFAAGRPIMVVWGAVTAAMLCFFIGALNREHSGRVHEKIGRLERIWQKGL